MNVRRHVLLILAIAATAEAQPAAIPPEARQTAAILGIDAAIDRLETLRNNPAEASARLLLRQQVMEAISEASMDVDGVIATIQREQAEIQAAQDRLSSQRDRLVGLTTAAATITGSGVGIVGSAMQFSDKTALAGDGVSVGSGAISTVLSLLSMRLQRGGKTRIDVAPNMLAKLFDRPSEEISFWPDDVWAYLNSAPASGQRRETRIESLMEEWTRQGRISSQGSQAAQQKIAFLTSRFSEERRLSLADLSDRSVMLADTRARVALMKRDLAQLLHYLRQSGS